MPQLTRIRRLNERGSVLVAVIAFAIILSISAGGLLMLAGNSVSRETAELDDYKTFHVAESGVLLGLRWLAVPEIWEFVQHNDTSRTETVNGMDVTVSTSRDGNGRLVLSSQVVNTRLMYDKVISCNVDSTTGFGLAVNSWDPAFPNLDNIWFDGPFHSNTPLQMANAPAVYFINGPVTVRDTLNDPAPCFGPSGNDYGYGITIAGARPGSTQGRMVDQYFDNTFTYTRDSVAAPWPDFSAIAPLPLNDPEATTRALLYFDTLRVDGELRGRARYYYYDAANNLQPFTPITPIDNVIFRAQNHINVLGVVQGRVTVVTDPGFDIVPVGDVNYADFTRYNTDESENYEHYNPVNNYGIMMTSENFLALISGGNIVFQGGYEQYLPNPANGVLVNRIVEDFTTILHLTAALMATNPGRGIIWTNNNLSAYLYKILGIGSRSVDQYFNYTSRFGAAANTQFRFYYDRRFDNNFAAPGIPAFRRITPGGNNLYLLKTTNWQETNISQP